MILVIVQFKVINQFFLKIDYYCKYVFKQITNVLFK